MDGELPKRALCQWILDLQIKSYTPEYVVDAVRIVKVDMFCSNAFGVTFDLSGVMIC